MSKAQRLAQEYCRDTCPAVDTALSDWLRKHDHLIPSALHRPLDDLLEAFKDAGTHKLRDALVSACGDLEKAEDRAEDLQDSLNHANSRIDDLKAELREALEAQHA